MEWMLKFLVIKVNTRMNQEKYHESHDNQVIIAQLKDYQQI